MSSGAQVTLKRGDKCNALCIRHTHTHTHTCVFCPTSDVFQLTAGANESNRPQWDYGVLPNSYSEVFSRCAEWDFLCHKLMTQSSASCLGSDAANAKVNGSFAIDIQGNKVGPYFQTTFIFQSALQHYWVLEVVCHLNNAPSKSSPRGRGRPESHLGRKK